MLSQNIHELPKLTNMEREILMLMAQGDKYKTIAKKLRLMYRTVGNYVSNVYSKLKVTNCAQFMLRVRNTVLGKKFPEQ